MTVAPAGIDYEELVKDDRVHGRLYYDPAIFQEEMERIWHRQWVYVGHESEVAEPGDYRTKRIGLQPVIMTRDEHGELHLLLNRCAHRGNTVCQSERGNASYLRCAYHGWTYSNSGELIGVTYSSAYDESFRKEEYGLAKAPRMAVYRGFVFGSLGAEGISLEEHLGQARKLLDRFVDLSPEGELAVAGTHKMVIKANWKMWAENAVDNYHGYFVHQSAFRLDGALWQRLTAIGREDTVAVARDLGGGHGQVDFWPQERLTGRLVRGFDAAVASDAERAYFEAMVQRHGKETAQQLLADGPPHALIFPNLFLINHDIRTIQPVTPTLSYNYMYPVLLKGAPAETNAQRLRQHEWGYGPAGFILGDDLEIFERNQRALEARVQEWMLLRRGMNRERLDEEGLRVGHPTGEVALRGIWRHYRKLMMST